MKRSVQRVFKIISLFFSNNKFEFAIFILKTSTNDC